MGLRAQKKHEEVKAEYLANASAILHLCKASGMRDQDAIYFSTLRIAFSNFEWFFKLTKGNTASLRQKVEKHIQNVENTKKRWMINSVDPEQEPETDVEC